MSLSKSYLDASPTSIFDCVVQSDFAVALLHVLNAVILLAEAGYNVSNLCEGELFFISN